VTDKDRIARLYAFVEHEFGHLDVLINNAAVYLEDGQGILSMPDDIFQVTLETNALGPLWLCRTFLPMMVAQNYGRVVNVSSGMGQIGDMKDDGAAYRVSKLALNGITRILADAVRGKNVLVNAVCPGWVRTDMGGRNAPRTLAQGAQGIVWAATLPEDGPHGGFFRDGKPVPW
jgi:NAD(P)-dependent dehydrogenase (short-subunit alcohol dehydrogenase family)